MDPFFKKRQGLWYHFNAKIGKPSTVWYRASEGSFVRVESEQRFRRGESPGKPWGGQIADHPFSQVLYDAAKEAGFECQIELSKALGYKSNCSVGQWYKAKRFPEPDNFGKILYLLKPVGEIREKLVDAYCKHLDELAISFRKGRKIKTKSETPFGQWLEQFCTNKQITLKEVGKKLGFSLYYRDKIGLEALSNILEVAPQALELTTEETAALAEIVAKTIEQAVLKGHRFRQNVSGARLVRIQKSLDCKTYTGQQAANKIGRSRERIRQLRQQFNLPLLLTNDDIEFLRNRPKAKGCHPKKN